MLAAPESSPMSTPVALREAQRIVWHLEGLATTPLTDTREVTLVDFTLDSPELGMSGTPCRRLFHERTPRKDNTLTETELVIAEEQLGAISLGTSTPLMSPGAPPFGASFTIGEADSPSFGPSRTSPCPASSPRIEHEVATPERLVPEVSPTAPKNMPPSPDKVPEPFAAGKVLGKASGDSESPGSSCSAVESVEMQLSATRGAPDSPCHIGGVARSDDGNLDSTPPEPSLALGESFVVIKGSPTDDQVPLDGSPIAIAETTFAIPDITPVETAAEQASAPSDKLDATMVRMASGSLRPPSSKRAALSRKSVPSPRPAPVQRPAGRHSVVTKPRAAPARPSAATRAAAAADTTFAGGVRPLPRATLVSKGAGQTKPVSSSGLVPKPVRKGAVPPAPAVAQRSQPQAVPTAPEPRRSFIPPSRASAAPRRSIQPVRSAIGGSAQASAARLSTVPENLAQRQLLPGARRSVAAISRATTAPNQPAPSQLPQKSTNAPNQPVPSELPQKATTGQTGQPSQLPLSRLRPPSKRASGSTSRVPRLTFRDASCLPQIPESPVAGRLSSTPAREGVPLSSHIPALTPIKKQPGRL